MEYFNFSDSVIKHYQEKSNTKYDSNDPAARWYLDSREKLYHLIELINAKLDYKFKVVYKEQPNGQAGRGKIVFKNYILAGFSDNESFGDNLFLKIEISGFDSEPQFALNLDLNFKKNNSPFHKVRDAIFKENYYSWNLDSNFPDNWEDLIQLLEPYLKKNYDVFHGYIKRLKDSNDNKKEMKNKIDLLKYKRQIILQGPPGTGKTREAKLLTEALLKENEEIDLESNECLRLVQFHPSYTYEDFVRGITAKSNKDKRGVVYEAEHKLLSEFAEIALENYLDSQKDVEVLSYEKWVESIFDEFIIYMKKRLEKKNLIELTEKVNIVSIDDDAFRYKGRKGWSKLGNRMLFEDIIKAIIDKNISRKDIKTNTNLSGLANWHASYYVRVVGFFNDFIKEKHHIYKATKEDKIKEKNFVLIIDEINRANLSSVLGELIYALEYRGEMVESMYEVNGKKRIILPPNLYIIGTMNTADRSVGHIDYAIRRRFAFVDVLPKDLSVDKDVVFDTDLFKTVQRLFTIDDKYNKASLYLSSEFEPKEVALGHSYFIDEKIEGGVMDIRLEYEIKPILREYIRDGILIGSDISQIVEDLKATL